MLGFSVAESECFIVFSIVITSTPLFSVSWMGFIFILQDVGHNDVSELTSFNGNIVGATGLPAHTKNMHNDAIYRVRVDYSPP